MNNITSRSQNQTNKNRINNKESNLCNMNYALGNTNTNASRIALRSFYNHNQFTLSFSLNNMNSSYNINQYNQSFSYLIPTITTQ